MVFSQRQTDIQHERRLWSTPDGAWKLLFLWPERKPCPQPTLGPGLQRRERVIRLAKLQFADRRLRRAVHSFAHRQARAPDGAGVAVTSGLGLPILQAPLSLGT